MLSSRTRLISSLLKSRLPHKPTQPIYSTLRHLSLKTSLPRFSNMSNIEAAPVAAPADAAPAPVAAAGAKVPAEGAAPRAPKEKKPKKGGDDLAAGMAALEIAPAPEYLASRVEMFDRLKKIQDAKIAG